MVTELFRRTLHGRISHRIISQLSMNTMDAMTSDRSVRRPRIRTKSERNRRRQSDRANHAPAY